MPLSSASIRHPWKLRFEWLLYSRSHSKKSSSITSQLNLSRSRKPIVDQVRHATSDDPTKAAFLMNSGATVLTFQAKELTSTLCHARRRCGYRCGGGIALEQ